MKALEAMNIGSISGLCDDRQHCMCALTDFKETMQLIFAKQELVEQMKFPEPEQQKRLFKELYWKYPALYTNMVKHRPANWTIFPHETGDNFRAASHQQNKQDSFTIVNLHQLITSPAGLLVNRLWQGTESREILRNLLSATYDQIRDCVRNGLKVNLLDGTTETFNVIVLYIADYSHKKEVLGRVGVNARYGCIHCKKP